MDKALTRPQGLLDLKIGDEMIIPISCILIFPTESQILYFAMLENATYRVSQKETVN